MFPKRNFLLQIVVAFLTQIWYITDKGVIQMTTGEKIKMLREQRGYTLEELGKRVGVGKSTVRKWETGFIENMGRDKIASLADVFGVSPNYFILEDEKMPTTPKDGEREEEYEESDLESIKLLRKLTPEEKKIVDAFVEGLIANR